MSTTLTAVFWFFGNEWEVGCWRSLILTHSELWYAADSNQPPNAIKTPAIRVPSHSNYYVY